MVTGVQTCALPISLHVGDWDLDVVEAGDSADAPLVLDDDALGEAATGVVLDEGPVERVLHVLAGGGEVGEIQHGDIVEVAGEVARVVAGVQPGELGNPPQPGKRSAEGLLGLVTEPRRPPVGHDLAEQRRRLSCHALLGPPFGERRAQEESG